MIGVFDSGVGGLTVLRELLCLLPEQDYIYLGDTARTPYGPKGAQTVLRYSRECAGFLYNHNIDILVIACNTASALALTALKEEKNLPIIGTVDTAARSAVKVSSGKRIAVIGTHATISSGVYEKTLKDLDGEIKIFSKSCPLFVPLAEEGMIGGEIVDKVVEHYLQDIKAEQVDTLILGCTHYPLLKDAIANYLGFKVNIVECSKSIAEEVKLLTEGMKLSRSGAQSSRQEYYVTDAVERFNKLAQLFLQRNGIECRQVSL